MNISIFDEQKTILNESLLHLNNLFEQNLDQLIDDNRNLISNNYTLEDLNKENH